MRGGSISKRASASDAGDPVSPDWCARLHWMIVEQMLSLSSSRPLAVLGAGALATLLVVLFGLIFAVRPTAPFSAAASPTAASLPPGRSSGNPGRDEQLSMATAARMIAAARADPWVIANLQASDYRITNLHYLFGSKDGSPPFYDLWIMDYKKRHALVMQFDPDSFAITSRLITADQSHFSPDETSEARALAEADHRVTEAAGGKALAFNTTGGSAVDCWRCVAVMLRVAGGPENSPIVLAIVDLATQKVMSVTVP